MIGVSTFEIVLFFSVLSFAFGFAVGLLVAINNR